MEFLNPALDVGIATRDAVAAKAFYQEVFGFESRPDASMGELGRELIVRCAGHTLRFYDFKKPPEPCEGGTEKANGIRLLAFILDDLDSVIARLQARNHPFRLLPVPEQTPYRVAFTTDHDGNALELVGLRQPAGAKLAIRMQIGLTVSDIARSRHFYGELLGLPEEPEMKLPASMGVVGNVRYGFRAGGTTIKFWSRGPELPTWSGAPGKRTGLRMITAFVPDVDTTHDLLRSRGVPIKIPPTDFENTARMMIAADPDNNWIEFVRPR